MCSYRHIIFKETNFETSNVTFLGELLPHHRVLERLESLVYLQSKASHY